MAKGLTGNAVAYIRVSTGKQAKSGLGLEAQIEATRAFAKAEGYKITVTFEEHERGKGADGFTGAASRRGPLFRGSAECASLASPSPVVGAP
jgi:Resolvase, N terminal domain